MKKLSIIMLLACGQTLWAQGTFVSPAFKSLIGRTYQEVSELSELNGFTSRGGSMLTDINDPEKLTGSWFSKGTTAVALFEIVNDDNSRKILDVLEINKVKANQELKIGECRDGDADMPGIIALVVSANDERVKAVRAWIFNRDKIRVESFSPSNVTCLGMVGDD